MSIITFVHLSITDLQSNAKVWIFLAFKWGKKIQIYEDSDYIFGKFSAALTDLVRDHDLTADRNITANQWHPDGSCNIFKVGIFI